MCGGAEQAFDRALPLLQRMGKNIRHMGSPGAGQHTKMCTLQSYFRVDLEYM